MIVFGEIDSIDGNKATVKVAEHDNAVYECFMLQPLSGKNKIDLPYAKDDLVLVLLQDGRNIIMGEVYNDVDTRPTNAGDDTFVFEAKKIYAKADDLFQFNNGSNKGLVKLDEVKNNLDQIKNYLTTLKAAIASGLSAVGAGTAANGGTGASTFNTAMALAEINFSDMENDKVKH